MSIFLHPLPGRRRSSIVGDPLNRLIGRCLKERRLLRGLSQNKVAEKLGLTFQQVQKYEQGKNRISLVTFLRLTAILGIEPAAFITRLVQEADLPASLDLSENRHSRRILMIGHVLARIDKRQRVPLLNLLRAMAKSEGLAQIVDE